jgi:hypothetical protein
LAGRRERTALLSGYGTVGLSSWHVWSTIGWLPPRPWNGGCCEVGEPARVLFDAAARDDQHKYSGRSLRETGRGSSLAASGGPPPLEIPGRGDTPGFFLGAGATPFRGIPNPRRMAVGTAFCLRCGVDVSGGSTLVGLRAAKPPLPPSANPAVPSAAAVTSAEFRAYAPPNSAGHSFAQRQSLARVCRCAEWGQQPEALLPLPYPYPRV